MALNIGVLKTAYARTLNTLQMVRAEIEREGFAVSEELILAEESLRSARDDLSATIEQLEDPDHLGFVYEENPTGWNDSLDGMENEYQDLDEAKESGV